MIEIKTMIFFKTFRGNLIFLTKYENIILPKYSLLYEIMQNVNSPKDCLQTESTKLSAKFFKKFQYCHHGC